MAKKNITITRYVDPQLGWEAAVRPEDGSWVLFLPRATSRPAEGPGSVEPIAPQLWHRVGTCEDEHGDTYEAFARDGSPEHRAFLTEHEGQGLALCEAFDASKCWPACAPSGAEDERAAEPAP